VGCSNYPEGGKDVALMAKEFLERNYIVVTTGCGAMSIGEYRTRTVRRSMKNMVDSSMQRDSSTWGHASQMHTYQEQP